MNKRPFFPRANSVALSFALLLTLWCSGQTPRADSLKQAFSSAKYDTTRCRILNAMIEGEPNDTVWVKYNDELFILSEKNLQKEKDPKLIRVYRGHKAYALKLKGYIAQMQGNTNDAMTMYTECMDIWKDLGEEKGVSDCMNNMAGIYHSLGDLSKAISLWEKCIALREKLGDKRGVGGTLNNLAAVHKDLKNYSKAREFHLKCSKILLEVNEMQGYGISLMNLGALYTDEKKYELSIDHYERAIEVFTQLKLPQRIAQALKGLGTSYRLEKRYDEALKKFNECIRIEEGFKSKQGLIRTTDEIGSVYLDQGMYGKAKPFIKKAFAMAREIGYPELIKQTSAHLHQIAVHERNFEEALTMYQLHIRMRDSIADIKSQKAALRSGMQYEFHIRSVADSVQHAKENEINNAELKRQATELKAKRNQQFMMIGVMVLILIFSGFMYNRYKLTQKQKRIIELQKEIVEEKQKEILDSILYARRIQQAQIPSERRIKVMIDRIKNA